MPTKTLCFGPVNRTKMTSAVKRQLFFSPFPFFFFTLGGYRASVWFIYLSLRLVYVCAVAASYYSPDNNGRLILAQLYLAYNLHSFCKGFLKLGI